MPYKVITVHVEESPCLGACLEIGCQLAFREGAHLIGMAVDSADGAEQPLTQQRKRERLFGCFEESVSRLAVASSAHHVVQGDAATEISQHGLCSDLIILGKEGSSNPDTRIDFLQYVIHNCGGPVVVVPAQASGQSRHETGERILIAWNGGMPAARAVRSALPMLRHAREVDVAHLRSPSLPDRIKRDSMPELLAYLARHGIHADALHHDGEEQPGLQLLQLAATLSSDMVVMGCVAHPRYPGVRLGGTTGAMLKSATIPVFMAA